MAEPELVIECFVTDPPRLEESFSLRLQSYITPEAWAELVRHLQAESTQCWADNTPQQTLNFCLSAALLYLGSFSPSVFLLPLAPLWVSLLLTFGYLAVLSGAILAYIRFNHAINSKAAAARNRVLDEVAQAVSSVVRPHGVTLTWKAAGATHHGQAAKNGFWLLELGANSMLSPLKHFDPATVLAPPPPSTAASPEAQMASEGVSPNPDVTLLAIDPAKASPRFFPLPSTLTDFITSSAYEDLLFYLERTRSEYNNMLLGWLDTYQQQILSGLVGSALPIIWLANRFVPNIAASMFVSSAGIWLMLALFMYAAAVFYPQRERERAIAHTHYHAGVALHATRVLEGHGMRLSWRPWASPCWELEADASKRPPSPLAEFFTAQTPSEGSDEESARTSDAIAHPLLPSVQKRELSERSEDFPSL